MPELPDVEFYGRYLDETSLGREIDGVRVTDARILAGLPAAAFAARLRHRSFTGTRRHGKHLLVRLDDGGWLTLHFGLTGGLKAFTDVAEDPPFDRVRFDFRDGGHLAYINRRMLGRIGLADDADAFIRGEELGPDALDPAFDRRAFRAAVAGSRRDVKSSLMDQSLMAGVGNIYSDEILFQAGIDPAARISELDDAALDRVFASLKTVLEAAIATGAGSERFLDRLPAHFLLPHRNKGAACPRCGTAIATRTFAGRTGYFCPRCQARPR